MWGKGNKRQNMSEAGWQQTPFMTHWHTWDDLLTWKKALRPLHLSSLFRLVCHSGLEHMQDSYYYHHYYNNNYYYCNFTTIYHYKYDYYHYFNNNNCSSITDGNVPYKKCNITCISVLYVTWKYLLHKSIFLFLHQFFFYLGKEVIWFLHSNINTYFFFLFMPLTFTLNSGCKSVYMSIWFQLQRIQGYNKYMHNNNYSNYYTRQLNLHSRVLVTCITVFRYIIICM